MRHTPTGSVETVSNRWIWKYWLLAVSSLEDSCVFILLPLGTGLNQFEPVWTGLNQVVVVVAVVSVVVVIFVVIVVIVIVVVVIVLYYSSWWFMMAIQEINTLHIPRYCTTLLTARPAPREVWSWSRRARRGEGRIGGRDFFLGGGEI